MHPLAKWFLPIGIGLIVFSFLWWLFQPFAYYLGQFWPQIAIAIGLGLFLWRFPLGQAEKVWQFFTIQPVRGILTAAALTAMYGGALWLGYIYLPPLLISELGISQRTAWLLITIVGLPAIPVIWRLYAITGIPGDPVAISRNFRVLAFLALVFFGWWFHSQPNILFDFKTGKSLFYVADSEEKIYFSSGNSPATGEKLRPGTAEDAKRFAKKSWLYHLERWWSTPPRHAQFRKACAARARIVKTFHVPAGETIATGIWMEKGKTARFSQSAPREYYIKSDRKDILIHSQEWVSHWRSAGQIGLRGGAVATEVTIKING